MKNVINYVSCLIAIFSVVSFSSCDLVRSSPKPLNETVEEVVKNYWISSLNADAEGVKKRVGLPPDGFLLDCIENLNNTNDHSLKVDVIESAKINRNQIIHNDTECDKSEQCNKANKYIKSLERFESEIPDYVRFFSSFIYVSHLNNSKLNLKIERIETFEDESIVFTKVFRDGLDPNESTENNPVFFMKKRYDTWKIIDISDQKTSNSEYNFAKPRNKCNN
jgi:hypothetical protein